MSIDLTDDPAGRATAFAAGCTATWVFVRNLVMKPAIKSCHQQIADLRDILAEYREQKTIDRARIAALETALFTSGIPALRQSMQGVVSEIRMEGEKQ